MGREHSLWGQREREILFRLPPKKEGPRASRNIPGMLQPLGVMAGMQAMRRGQDQNSGEDWPLTAAGTVFQRGRRASREHRHGGKWVSREDGAPSGCLCFSQSLT